MTVRLRDFLDTLEQMDDAAMNWRIEACARKVDLRVLKVVVALSKCLVVASEWMNLLPCSQVR